MRGLGYEGYERHGSSTKVVRSEENMCHSYSGVTRPGPHKGATELECRVDLLAVGYCS